MNYAFKMMAVVLALGVLVIGYISSALSNHHCTAVANVQYCENQNNAAYGVTSSKP